MMLAEPRRSGRSLLVHSERVHPPQPERIVSAVARLSRLTVWVISSAMRAKQKAWRVVFYHKSARVLED
jgi:hypothetical protein